MTYRTQCVMHSVTYRPNAKDIVIAFLRSL